MWNAKGKGYEYAHERLLNGQPLAIQPHWSKGFREGIAEAIRDFPVEQERSTCASAWYVWSPQSGPPTVQHPTKELAKQEAMRLARKVGDEFMVLEVVGVARAVDVEWIDKTQ